MSKIDSVLTRVDVGDDVSSDQATRVALPVGTVTLLMADAEGSTRLWESEPDAMAPATVSHDRIVNEAIGRHGGVKPKDQGEGDSFMAAFSRPSDALEAAVEIQSQLLKSNSPLRLRMAIHTGEVQLRDESNNIGIAVNRAARLRAIGHGGQILISQVTHDLVADHPPSNVAFKELGTHRLKDLARPEQVFQVMHSDLPDDFPTLRSLDALPNNLPAQRSSFIGRDAEIKALARLLAETRLLTLSGSGGAGKTRLGLQLGAELLEEFADGVWFISLASVTEDDAVERQIASVLGVGESDAKILPTFIGAKAMMVILDNAEQVINGTSQIVSKLLDECPNLKVLVTTREPLAVEGETTYRVPSLTLPAEGSRLPINSLTEYEAIQLFVDRATKARPNFLLDGENASFVTDICRRIDGIPLAIELAAARVRVLSPSQIRQGLSDRFRLLTGSSRTAVPRQQTLRASVEWSYDLLDDTEKVAFRRLAVFSAAFDLDAAEAVISSDDLPKLQILEVLTQLVDKSLVVATDEGDATGYSMLETVAQFALGRLIGADEEESLRFQHARYFASFTDRMWEALKLETSLDEFFSQRSILENIETALTWSIDRGEVDCASRLFAGVWSAYSEGRDWLGRFFEKLLELAEPGSIERGRILAAVSPLAGMRWNLAPYANEAVETLKTLPEDDAGPYLPSALWGVAMITMYMDRPNSLEVLQELQDAADRVGQGYWSTWAEAMSGYVLCLEDAPDEGLPIMKGAIERARGCQSEILLGHMLFQTGLAHSIAKRATEALPFYEEAVPLQRRVGKKMTNVTFQWALDHTSHLYMEMGRPDDARPLLQEALRYSRDYDLEGGNYWNILQNWAAVKLEEGLSAEAIKIQTEALEGLKAEAASKHGERDEARYGEHYLRALTQLASMEMREGNREKGVELLEQALRTSLDYELRMGLTGQTPVRRVDLPLNSFIRTHAKELPARCTRLLGFVDAWIDSSGLRRSDLSERKRVETIETIGEHLGSRRIEAELKAGRSLAPESAVAYALEDKADPLVDALVEADNTERSLRTGAQVQDVVSTDSARVLSEAGFSIASAIVLLAQGLHAKDEDDLHAALSTLVEVEDPILVAVCLEALAEIAADQESFEESARLCGAALSLREGTGQASMPCTMSSTHTALGADAFDAIVEEGKKLSMQEAAEYAARGRGERKRPSSGWSSLTPAEMKVAKLVAEGLTNPHIAERLFVSRRTVQTHLYNIFAKVGVETRTELAAEMVRRGEGESTKGAL